MSYYNGINIMIDSTIVNFIWRYTTLPTTSFNRPDNMGKNIRIVCMPHVTKTLIDEFIIDLQTVML